jgi:hypothetical protein
MIIPDGVSDRRINSLIADKENSVMMCLVNDRERYSISVILKNTSKIPTSVPIQETKFFV